MRMTPLLLLLVLAVPLLGGCASMSKTSNALWLESEDADVAQGESLHKEILERTPEYTDPALANFVSRVGNRLAAVSDRPSLSWKFTVLDSAIENAFATMGGYVYITRGLLIYLRDENDVAAILAHEIAHICRRDSVHMRQRQSLAGIATLGLVIAAPITLLVPQVAVAPASLGLSALNRSDEAAADQLGTIYLSRAGYPPEAMQELLDIISSIESYKKATDNVRETWWHRASASHPQTEQRKRQLTATTGSQGTKGKTTSSEFLSVLANVEVGNPAEGIPAMGKRYFPDLALSVEVPDGWRANAWRGRHQISPGLWLTNEKSRANFSIQKHSAKEDATDACELLRSDIRLLTVEELAPLEDSDTSRCGALASFTSGFLIKTKVWQRIGVIQLDDGSYFTLTGRAPHRNKTDETFKSMEQSFLRVAKSMVAVTHAETPSRQRLQIHYVKAGDSFDSLATKSGTPVGTPAFLRVLNLRAANDELAPGETIKIVK
jgi:predicted Zn-dependent protease